MSDQDNGDRSGPMVSVLDLLTDEERTDLFIEAACLIVEALDETAATPPLYIWSVLSEEPFIYRHAFGQDLGHLLPGWTPAAPPERGSPA